MSSRRLDRLLGRRRRAKPAPRPAGAGRCSPCSHTPRPKQAVLAPRGHALRSRRASASPCRNRGWEFDFSPPPAECQNHRDAGRGTRGYFFAADAHVEGAGDEDASPDRDHRGGHRAGGAQAGRTGPDHDAHTGRRGRPARRRAPDPPRPVPDSVRIGPRVLLRAQRRRVLARWTARLPQGEDGRRAARGAGGPRPAPRLLDFGCASGRVLRHVACQQDRAEPWGCDIARNNVEWISTHLPRSIRVFQNTIFPHLPVEDRFFDVICAFSVFTHIDDFEDLWLLELRRVLRPGGIAFLTIHSERSWLRVRHCRGCFTRC